MAIDPANHLVVGLGNPDVGKIGGLKYTLDGGAGWVGHSDIPAPTAEDRGMAVAFDPDAPVIGGRTQTVYVWSHGRGIYRSYAGIDGRFTPIPGSPIDIGHMVARGGALWTAGSSDGGPGNLRKWTPGSGWSDIAGVQQSKHIAISPDGKKIIAMIASSAYQASVDGGSRFSGLTPSIKRKAAAIGWHQTTNENYMSNGACVWDTDDNVIYIAEGIGCWQCIDPPMDGSVPTFLEDSVGIENLVSMQVLVPPGNSRIHYISQDRSVITREWWQYKIFPDQVGVSNLAALDHAGGIDFCPGDENILGLVSSSNGRGNFSADGGTSWTKFPAVPGNVEPWPPVDSSKSFGGNISCGGPANFVWLPTSQRIPSFTTDRGGSWNYCRFDGSVPPETFDQGNTRLNWHGAYFLQRQILVSDKQHPGTHYIYCVGNEVHDATSRQFRGLWKSTDGGANFTRKRSTVIGPSLGTDAFNGKLKMPYGYSPHLWWCCGDIDADDTHANAGLYFSDDDGVSFIEVTGVREPLDFAFGKAAPGATYPAIYAWGGLKGVRGLHRCLDFNPAKPTAASWETIGRYPGGIFDSGNVMAADMQEFGLVYVGFGGSGLFRATTTYRLDPQ
jgi:hypothetical protein